MVFLIDGVCCVYVLCVYVHTFPPRWTGSCSQAETFPVYPPCLQVKKPSPGNVLTQQWVLSWAAPLQVPRGQLWDGSRTTLARNIKHRSSDMLKWREQIWSSLLHHTTWTARVDEPGETSQIIENVTICRELFFFLLHFSISHLNLLAVTKTPMFPRKCSDDQYQQRDCHLRNIVTK